MLKSTDHLMQKWIADVCHMMFQLQQIKVEVADKHFVVSLDASYQGFESPISETTSQAGSDSIRSEHVISRLLNEEARQTGFRSESKIAADTTYYMAESKKCTPVKHITCYKCGKKGHYQAQCHDVKKTEDGAAVAINEDGLW